jgi:hypothetical protein
MRQGGIIYPLDALLNKHCKSKDSTTLRFVIE